MIFLGILAALALQLSASAFGFGLLLLGDGLVSLLSGYGLLKARKWVRTSGVLTGIGNLAVGIVLALSQDLGVMTLGIIAMILGAGTFIYIRRARTKEYLGG